LFIGEGSKYPKYKSHSGGLGAGVDEAVGSTACEVSSVDVEACGSEMDGWVEVADVDVVVAAVGAANNEVFGDTFPNTDEKLVSKPKSRDEFRGEGTELVVVTGTASDDEAPCVGAREDQGEVLVGLA